MFPNQINPTNHLNIILKTIVLIIGKVREKINIIILNIISNKSGLTFVPGDLHFDFRYTQVKDKK